MTMAKRRPQSTRSAAPAAANLPPAAVKKSSPIPRQSLASAVAERLREQILNGQLREGQQLRQEAIAEEFQISRIPVREALSIWPPKG
jgi:DNA-binding GntR family transcriptional regulator